jgi:hypothetical protein
MTGANGNKDGNIQVAKALITPTTMVTGVTKSYDFKR